jgi:hypothetical protein
MQRLAAILWAILCVTAVHAVDVDLGRFGDLRAVEYATGEWYFVTTVGPTPIDVYPDNLQFFSDSIGWWGYDVETQQEFVTDISNVGTNHLGVAGLLDIVSVTYDDNGVETEVAKNNATPFDGVVKLVSFTDSQGNVYTNFTLVDSVSISSSTYNYGDGASKVDPGSATAAITDDRVDSWVQNISSGDTFYFSTPPDDVADVLFFFEYTGTGEDVVLVDTNGTQLSGTLALDFPADQIFGKIDSYPGGFTLNITLTAVQFRDFGLTQDRMSEVAGVKVNGADLDDPMLIGYAELVCCSGVRNLTLVEGTNSTTAYVELAGIDGNFVVVPNNDVRNKSTGSVGVWARFPSDDNGIHTLWHIGDNAVNDNDIVCYIRYSNDRLFVEGVNDDTGTEMVWRTVDDFTDNLVGTWHHVFVDQDGTELAVYVDGQLVSGVFDVSTDKGFWTDDFDNPTSSDIVFEIGAEQGTYYYNGGVAESFLFAANAGGTTATNTYYHGAVYRGYLLYLMDTNDVTAYGPNSLGANATVMYGMEDIDADGTTPGSERDWGTNGTYSLTLSNVESITLTNGTTTGYTGGRVFNGSSSYGEYVVADWNGSSTSGTVVAWFSTSSSASYQTLVASGDVASGDGFIQFGVNTSGEVEIKQQTTGAGATTIINGNTTVNDGDIHYAVYQSSGTNYLMYVDGILQSLTVSSGSDNGEWWGDTGSARDNLTIGVRHNGGTYNQYFDGTIYEASVFGDVWSSNTVNSVYITNAPTYNVTP